LAPGIKEPLHTTA